MDELIVVTHPEPLVIEARPLEAAPPVDSDDVALAYYHDGNLIARGFVAPEAVKAIRGILTSPVSVALAASEDDNGNIEARFCLVLPVDPDKLPVDDDEEGPEEPWRESVPLVPDFETVFDATAIDASEDGDRPRMALLPIGNIVRNARERRHPDDVARDLRDMLLNLLEGRSSDAVAKAIDDLLNSL